MQRSVVRGGLRHYKHIPDYASLHPGYELDREEAYPDPGGWMFE